MKIKNCKTIILYAELYACETWSLKLGEEHDMRLLRKIFGCWKGIT
jgi:hypothetical protein